mgnify:CR=1 FL=1
MHTLYRAAKLSYGEVIEIKRNITSSIAIDFGCIRAIYETMVDISIVKMGVAKSIQRAAIQRAAREEE